MRFLLRLIAVYAAAEAVRFPLNKWATLIIGGVLLYLLLL